MLVALSAAVVVITAVTVLVVSSLSNVQFSKNQNLATQYAQEGMEIVRRLRDTNPSNFFVGYTAGRYCLEKNSQVLQTRGTSLGDGCPTSGNPDPKNIDGVFARMIEIQERSGFCNNQTRVIVTVSWSDGKCASSATLCHQARLVSCLSNFSLAP